MRWSGLVGLAVVLGAGGLSGCGNPVVGHDCPEGTTLCGSACVVLRTDRENCGACGRACADDEACEDGACRAITCGPGELACGGACVDPRTDERNCGRCGVVCPAGAECRDGLCSGGDCPPPRTDCSGVCTDLRTDPANCGSCGRACASGELCQRGTCVRECLPGYVVCDGACVDTGEDPRNCGACGRACAAGEVCEAGECRLECLPGHVECGGGCVDPTRDPDNCGACGHACTPGVPCVDGECRAPCPPGTTDCGGECVDLTTDPAHCGACGRTCDPGDVCRSGSCTLDCPPGRTACGGECVDLTTDPAHCGSCGHACASGESCFAGMCLVECPDGYTACSGSCVDLTSDPDHCGSCGHVCTTGICEESVCSEAVPGHLVLVGHDYARFRRAQLLLVSNAVFSWAPTNPVQVAVLTAWTQTGSGTAANNVDLAISQAALERGRTWERTAFGDPGALAAALPDFDVVVIYEQSLAADTDLRAAGTTLATPLETFLRRGGVVLVLDACVGNGGTWQILDAAGLLSVAGCTNVTGARVSVLAPGDAVASGVPLTYVAERDSVRFESSETTQVVGDGTGPVVLHKVVRP